MRIAICFLVITFAIFCFGAPSIRRSAANTINVVINKDSKSIKVGFFKNIGDYQPSFEPEQTIDLAPGASKSVTLSQGWEGRVQKLTGAPADPATWAEIKFDASFQDMTFCFTQNVFPTAPSQFKTKDSGHYDVLQPTQPYTGGTNTQLVDYYRKVVSIGNGYILPDDNASAHGTNDKTIDLAIY